MRTNGITPQHPRPLTIPSSLKTLQITLEQAGWEIVALDIDGVDGRFNFALKRWDGPDDHLLVTVRADRLGRCSITREAVHRWREGTRVYVTEKERITLLGRDTYSGLLAGLKALAVYDAVPALEHSWPDDPSSTRDAHTTQYVVVGADGRVRNPCYRVGAGKAELSRAYRDLTGPGKSNRIWMNALFLDHDTPNHLPWGVMAHGFGDEPGGR